MRALSWIGVSRRQAMAAASLAAIALSGARGLPSHAAAAESTARLEFDHPGGEAAAVEVDLGADTFRSVLGLSDAAIEGVASGLLKGANGAGHEQEVQMAADQLAAVRQIVKTLEGAVDEVRVRVYNGGEGTARDPAAFYADKLSGGPWKKIVQVRDSGKAASVFLLQDDGALRGVFVVASDGGKLVLVNVVCDLSPERVKNVSEQATSMGVKYGGENALKDLLNDIRGHQG